VDRKIMHLNAPMAGFRINNRLLPPLALVSAFAIVLVATVIGALVWTAYDARTRVLDQEKSDLKNLAHSLAEHGFLTFQNVDLVLASLAELYSPSPSPANINRYLRTRRQGLPQVSEFGILDEKGDWKSSSLNALPTSNEADSSWFTIHQDIEDSAVQISAPLHLRGMERWTVIVSRRINQEDGGFGGVAFAAIDLNFFAQYYKTFDVGKAGGIALFRTDGKLLAHSRSTETGVDLSNTALFKTNLALSPRDTLRIVSPLDNVARFLAYEQCQNYFMLITVAESEDEVLAPWRADVRSKALFAAAFLGVVALFAVALGAQFRHRQKIEKQLRDREARYRVLAENAGDVVMQFERRGTFTYVSPAAERVLGWTEQALIGKRCVEYVHPEDMAGVNWAFSELRDRTAAKTITYRMRKADLSHVWVETHFRRTTPEFGEGHEIVAGLRDVTERRAMEEELHTLNKKLASLATTDGLTGLANRRAFDQFLRNHEGAQNAALLMIDIDHFKQYNDHFGHLRGDQCLRAVADAIGALVQDANGFAARYGGEEFAIVLPLTSEAQAILTADAIHTSIRDLNIANPASEFKWVTLSIGIAHKGDRRCDVLEVLREADLALYQAKRCGRNQTVLGSALTGAFLETSDAPATARLEP
jgi:diguanylate cyclase (GGDEF)-like protein/PAS domain S-box-containing protein